MRRALKLLIIGRKLQFVTFLTQVCLSFTYVVRYLLREIRLASVAHFREQFTTAVRSWQSDNFSKFDGLPAFNPAGTRSYDPINALWLFPSITRRD
jgi:hypothetical protein